MSKLELVQVHVYARHAGHQARGGRGLPVTVRSRNDPESGAGSSGYTPRPACDIAFFTGADAAAERADPRRIAPSFRCRPARDSAIVLSNDSSTFSINPERFSSEACS